MASGIYSPFKVDLMKKLVNLSADTINVALYDTSFAFAAANTAYNTTSELATAGGYTQGGTGLGALSVTASGATAIFSAANAAWGSTASFSAAFALLYDTSNSNRNICAFDFGGAKTVSSGTFTIAWNAAGIITMS